MANKPNLIDRCGLFKVLPNTGRQSPLSPTLLFHYEKLIDPINTFVIPFFTASSQVGKQLSKTVGGVLSGQVLQLRYDFAIIFSTLIVILRSR